MAAKLVPMLKAEYPRLLGTPEASRVAAATRDLMEYVHGLARERKLPRDFQHRLGKVAYHAPCHLRAQNIGFRSRDLLGLVADEVVLVDACSARRTASRPSTTCASRSARPRSIASTTR